MNTILSPQALTNKRVIKPKRGLVAIDFAELWRYRELFVFLTWRNIIVRYKQAAVGIVWVLVRPIMAVIVSTVIFGKLAKLPSDGLPYPLLVFTALLPWQFFASSLTAASSSVVAEQGMVTKIYFPRLIIPASAILASMVDLLISFVVFIGLMIWYNMVPTLAVLWLPCFFLLAFFASCGISMWSSALNVKYRDVRAIVPYMLQFGFYISPVAYTSSIVPEKWRLLYSLNPMVGVIESFRWALLGQKVPFNFPNLILSAAIILVIFVSGVYYFKRMERTFADVI